MDNSDLSGRRNNSGQRSPDDDVPEALRDLRDLPAQSKSRSKLYLLVGGLFGLGAIALVASFWYVAFAPPKNTATTPAPAISPTPSTTQSAAKVNPPKNDSDTLLGHLPYTEAPQQELQPIVAGSQIKLRHPAALEFQAMVRAARASGIVIVPISGFRSIQEQQHVYFDVQAQRGQTVTKRAEVSAPPGYSEHHTGYAVDVGDGATPATNLNPNFDKTKAFQWLNANASRFHFEMSFPKDNPQGVSYEPWHWRFVGDRQSLETFYKAKNLTRNTP